MQHKIYIIFQKCNIRLDLTTDNTMFKSLSFKKSFFNTYNFTIMFLLGMTYKYIYITSSSARHCSWNKKIRFERKK